MYQLSEEMTGYYIESDGHDRAIRYDDDQPTTLCLSVYFESEEQAMKFAATVRNWKFHHPFVGGNLGETRVDDVPKKLPPNPILPIKLIDYDPSQANDSPCTSLADFRGTSSILPTEAIPLTDPLSKYQSVESQGVFALRNPYKLHIKDKAKFKNLREEENNMLARSWTFHQLFDGLHTNEGHLVPSLGVEFVQRGEKPTAMEDGELRYEVVLHVHFFSTVAEDDINSSLKTGSKKRRGREVAHYCLCYATRSVQGLPGMEVCLGLSGLARSSDRLDSN